MILDAFRLALAQLFDRQFRGVLLRGFGWTIALLTGFGWLTVEGVGWLIGDSVTLPWIGTVGWVDDVWTWAAIPLMLVLSIFLMIPVASAIVSMSLEEIAQAVEDKHYPTLPAADPIPMSDALRDTVGFLGILVVANIGALLLSLLFPPTAPLILWGTNGFLLGREYFTVAAMRRVGRARARRLWRRHLPTIWIAGALMTVPLTIPVMNLVIPVLGAATFTHIYHRLEAR